MMEVDDGTPAVTKAVRCARCDCSFKRHERIHDNNKRFACKQCSKLFTRSDILRRHEATHAAQVDGAQVVSLRACTECARLRERCTRSSTCQRCLTKGLRCTYPQTGAGARTPDLRFDSGSGSQVSLEAPQRPVNDIIGMANNAPRQDRRLEVLVEPEPTNGQSAYMHYQPMVPFEMSGFPQSQMSQPTMDYPMNWLPPDPSLAIDYDNVVGLGIGSLDFFSFQDTTTDVNSTQSAAQQNSAWAGSLMGHLHANSASERVTQFPSSDRIGVPWDGVSPETSESYIMTDSPLSGMQPVSPSRAPGGLYATSANGARMPCTIRARRSSRLIPGAKPIRPLSKLKPSNVNNSSEPFTFPDTSHLSIGTGTDATANTTSISQSLSSSVYDNILQSFRRLCLTHDSGFQSYASPVFPHVDSLNLCVRLYFENFDSVLPILHNQIVSFNEHWVLALAVSAIGCQYAEADEFAQMVEPMHEFLRRAIASDIKRERLETIGQDAGRIAFIQALTLSQVGMLYSGSSRLLGFARDQHSATVELTQALMLTIAGSELSLSAAQDGAVQNLEHGPWMHLLLDECRRRICFSLWLLDCMAVYHFRHRPSMPRSVMSMSLPNDDLWRTRSAAEWAMKGHPLPDVPSLSSAVVSLFRDNKVASHLGQFGRVVLLHAVYCEIFVLKDCFEGPLGDWVPSMQQQAAAENSDIPATPSVSRSGGKSLLNSWRNAALDCVDVLHWAANGTIALQAGVEHPTVLHLHLSRTILLTPFDTFQTLADSVISFAQRGIPRNLDAASRQTVVQAERDILEWAQRDQCKARLAVLHSGCLFWHIRRYSCRAFYEPIAVFLATLTIWAYSSYTSRSIESAPDSPHPSDVSINNDPTDRRFRNTSQNDENCGGIDDEDAEPAPTFIHLDRPNDDEMVQAFVRFGTASAMRANITGVGDIYSNQGPTKVLKEGRKILSTVSTAWGRTDRYSAVLEALEQIASGRINTECERTAR